MNKDMINIDDFVREKLGNREEKEDPAAWLRMKALLDKEMPERAIPLGFRFGKPLAYLGLALLAALVSVGGYKLITNTNTPEAPITAANNTGNAGTSRQTAIDAAPGNTATVNGNSATGAHPDNINNNNNNNTGNDHNTGNTTAGTAINDNRSNGNAATTPGSKVAAPADGTITNTAANNNTPAARSKNTQVYNSNTANSLNSKPAQQVPGPSKASQSGPAANTATNNAGGAARNSSTVNNNSTDRTTAANTAPGNSGSYKPAAQSTATTQDKPLAPRTDAATTSNNPDNSRKDSIVAVGVIKRTTGGSGLLPRKTTYISDSIDLGKVAVTTPAPEQPVADPAPEQPKEKSTAANNYRNPRFLGAKTSRITNPATTAPAAANENTTAAATSTSATVTTVKKKRDYLAFIRNIHFDEIVDNVKHDIGHAQFYMGAGGGFNYSPSAANSFRGVQFGATGELVFNRHLSLMGELKYFNRSGGYKTVDDSYIKEHTSSTPDSSSMGNNWYTMRTDSTNRYFNFSTLHSFEMPVTLRYAFRKFYLMTGINVAYYLGLNVEEINNQYNNLNPRVVGVQTSRQPIPKVEKPQLDIQDFGTRYGIGYIFGAGYQVNPSLQIDLRLVNTFWDNSKTEGAKHLSRDFYKIPSVQLNIGYQFNREKKEPARFGPGQ
jgi:hypothetical protein